MNELVKIQEKDGQQLVSARDLHSFLEVTERFNSWADRNFKYVGKWGRDFTAVNFFTPVNNGAKVDIGDYALTLSMAKQLAMMAKSEKGKEARKYFIECEKQLKSASFALAPPSNIFNYTLNLN